MTRIAVITISLNQARFLRQTLESLVRQSAPPDELIVIDGGSTDGSLDILKEYQGCIDELVVGEDNGPVNALNIGLRRASGDVILCVNAGDGLLEGALERARVHLEPLSGRFILYGDGVAIDEDDRTLRPFISTLFTARRYVLGGALALHQATFYAREALESLGGFDERNRWSWDGELLARASLDGVQLVRVSERIGVIRVHAGAISSAARGSEAAQTGQSRLFNDVMRRQPRRLDKIAGSYLRLEKHIRNPAYSASRAMSALGCRTTSQWPWWSESHVLAAPDVLEVTHGSPY